MKILFETSFAKDLKNINDSKVFSKVKDLIAEVKQADNLADINNVKKLHGSKDYFRIRLGNYRIGFELSEDTIIFVRILHRKDIYKRFP
ncbi:MAG: type II toxin-antitoxin system RelE/ParE family toxin [Candidatus Delongbacteria bacterium]|nr:type II toxin-antitoxin system RelE/ParE family toxin [Candidatus Delongbacteria bacterium]